MAIEIEHKFLVCNESWRPLVTRSFAIEQGYLATTGTMSVRVRLRDGTEGFLTIKHGTDALARSEFEYPIPPADARAMLGLAAPNVLVKRRHLVPVGPHVFEVDVFEGTLAGLVLAEVELDRVGEPFTRPDWLGAEVSADARYTNASLATNGRPPL